MGSSRRAFGIAGLLAVSMLGGIVASPAMAEQVEPHATGTASRVAFAPVEVKVTIPASPGQEVTIPTPPNHDSSVIPQVGSDTPALRPATATYSADGSKLFVSVINVNPNSAMSGKLTVAGWGVYDMTIPPNLGQLVYVPIPSGYDTSKLPTVAIDAASPQLRLLQVGYGYQDGVQRLLVNLGNPFPSSALSGVVQISW